MTLFLHVNKELVPTVMTLQTSQYNLDNISGTNAVQVELFSSALFSCGTTGTLVLQKASQHLWLRPVALISSKYKSQEKLHGSCHELCGEPLINFNLNHLLFIFGCILVAK